MSKGFYSYLSEKLIKYLNSNSIKSGDRFYVQLDDDEKVEEFYNVLKNLEDSKEFIYKHEQGSEYKTFIINLKGVDLVVASTSNATSNYLVTLRNAPKEDKTGQWDNKAVLFLCGEPLDSIKVGCCDLMQEGMPFSVHSISDNLDTIIKSSELSKVDKEIVKFYKDMKLSDSYNISIWDYKEILEIIQDKGIDKETYKEIGLFPDKSLDSHKNNSTEIRKRIKENNMLFTKVSSYEDYDDKEKYLEKVFDNKGVDELKKDTWKDVDFGVVKKSYESNIKDEPLKYEENKDKHLENDIVYWEKQKAKTAAGERKRHIIIFNDSKADEINISFSFDKTLSTEYIESKSKPYLNARGKKLHAILPADKYESRFYKLIYNHENKSKSKYEFNIAIVNIKEDYLFNIKTNYEIRTGSGKKNRIQVNNDGSEIKFGNGSFEKEIHVDESDNIVEVSDGNLIKISNFSEAWENDSLEFLIESESGIVPIIIKEENLRSKPIKSVNLLKGKREDRESYIREANKIKKGTEEFYLDEKLKVTLDREYAIIEKGILYGEEELGEIKGIDLEISEELSTIYNKILSYYKEIDNCPSLTYLDDKIIALYKEYIEIYNKEIERIEVRKSISASKNKKDLLKLGTIKYSDKVLFSPFAPLNVAYMLEVYNQLENEEIESNILESLTPNNLLPYIYSEDETLFKPVIQKDNIEWMVFEGREKVSIGETNVYVARLVKEKIGQFIKNFSYLFPKNSSAPIRINVINIENDKEVVKGVFEFLKQEILDGKNIIPIEIKIFNSDNTSAFDKFFSITSIEKLEEEFGISFKDKTNKLDEIDVMRLVLENMKYYKSDSTDYSYAHISFFKPGEEDKEAHHNASDMESGISLGGLLSTVTSNNDSSDYRIGFGCKNIINSNNLLIRTVLNINEYAANCQNKGVNPYIKDMSIVTRPLTIDDDVKVRLFNNSHWITFIEPNFGLEYFNDNNDDNLIVIHYSDQYSATDRYDTITVTNKSNQYKHIIKEFLDNKDINISDEKLNEVIKSFNSINGEWLLNLIANKSQYDREKLSIISALKYGLALLNHEDILWIPVSLEEILRVSNAVKLNKSEGIFSVKNLKEKGVHSDDLIFIGLNIKDPENLKVYYYPVEVKIGYNFSNVVDKGKTQVKKTYELLRKQLYKYGSEEHEFFKNKFYRNFFMKLFITNAQKLVLSNMWPDKHLERIEALKRYLLNDNYKVSFELESVVGTGALVSFKKDNHWRSVKKEDGVTFVELTEDDAYYGIEKDINTLLNEILSGNMDINPDILLANKDLDSLEENIVIEAEEEVTVEEEVAVTVDEDIENKDSDVEESSNEIEIDTDEKYESINNARVLLGKADGSTKDIYWEFGNKGLANRHMLITGKSGNGKTYFIQCALKELIDQGVPAIIIDYTDGFKSSQLEPKFKEYLGDRLQQFIVARDKFPLSPFKKRQKELDEDLIIEEDSVDVAERFKSIISAVYKTLGVQQLNCIYDAVIRGLDKYDGKLNLRAFRDELEEDTSSNAQTALAQLRLLIDKNPFEDSQEFDWSELENGAAKVFIIQLAGFKKDIQKIITEMILWDLWYYKTEHGSKDKPFAVVLDEAQNLNFGDSSPSTKILTEGRKFGWSAWFSTQFLKGQMDKATISRLQNSAQKIYFAQTEEEAPTVANIFADNNDERKQWSKNLINLEKGECISYGPMEGNDDKLIPSKPVKIKITSLTDRI